MSLPFSGKEARQISYCPQLISVLNDLLTRSLAVLWAQRSSTSEPEKNYVYLTISVPDVSKSSMKLDLKPTSLSFTGASETKKTTYHVDLEFFDEIDVENSKTNHTARDIEMILRKKELKEEYWPRLLKDKAKVHFLKTDFDKVRSIGSLHGEGSCT
jgi:CS domain